MYEFLLALYRIFSFFGFILILALTGAAFYDYRTLRSPLDANSLLSSATGLVKRGYVLDGQFHCTSGYAGINLFKIPLFYKQLDEKSITRYNFKKICTERNFKPGF